MLCGESRSRRFISKQPDPSASGGAPGGTTGGTVEARSCGPRLRRGLAREGSDIDQACALLAGVGMDSPGPSCPAYGLPVPRSGKGSDDDSDTTIQWTGWKTNTIHRKLGSGDSGLPLASEDFVAEIWAHMLDEERDSILNSWASRRSAPVYVASLCSGTDAPIVALGDCQSVYNRAIVGRCGDGLVPNPCCYVQTLACELDVAKRRYIRANSALPVWPLVFHRIEQVSTQKYAQEGPAANGSGPFKRVPRHDVMLWSSFSCKSASTENANRNSNGSCIEDGSGETGETFVGTVDFASSEDGNTKLGVSENVIGLMKKFGAGDGQLALGGVASTTASDDEGQLDLVEHQRAAVAVPSDIGNSNMAALSSRFAGKGFIVVSVPLNNKWFLLPHSRWRVWFIYCHPARLQITIEDAWDRMQRFLACLNRLVVSLTYLTLDIGHLLLKDTDPRIVKMVVDLERRKESLVDEVPAAPSKRLRRRHSEDGLGTNWVPSMRKEYDAAGLTWVEPPLGAGTSHGHVGKCELNEELEMESVWYHMLPTREKYVLHLIQTRHPCLPGQHRVIVTTRSVGRCCNQKPSVEECPCLLPHHRYWLEWKHRWIIGPEKMALQGIFQFDDVGMSPTMISDLAGNAVGTSVCAAINMSLMFAFGDVL